MPKIVKHPGNLETSSMYFFPLSFIIKSMNVRMLFFVCFFKQCQHIFKCGFHGSTMSAAFHQTQNNPSTTKKDTLAFWILFSVGGNRAMQLEQVNHVGSGR